MHNMNTEGRLAGFSNTPATGFESQTAAAKTWLGSLRLEYRALYFHHAQYTILFCLENVLDCLAFVLNKSMIRAQRECNQFGNRW